MIKISSGGGGVGSPFERDPDQVREDVVNELVSLESARVDYGVILDPETFAVDEAATRAIREAAA
jgi:N-methylhydantoinase B/oxoprolinase/acetone carboxylase alpha subunit